MGDKVGYEAWEVEDEEVQKADKVESGAVEAGDDVVEMGDVVVRVGNKVEEMGYELVDVQVWKVKLGKFNVGRWEIAKVALEIM